MSILSYATFSPSIAIAQQEVVKTLDEIVIIGTRRQGRTAVETAVPVDVFNRPVITAWPASWVAVCFRSVIALYDALFLTPPPAQAVPLAHPLPRSFP